MESGYGEKIRQENITPTRGNGLLEGFLAKKRTEIANRLISGESRNGRILDVGCGTYPFFLENTNFREKFGVDKVVDEYRPAGRPASLFLTKLDISHDDILPFNERFFDVVTMLAVIEHIESNRVVGILRECHRVLKDGGILILTTPAGWTEKLLRGMAMLRLVSSEEISEHKDTYNHSKIASILCDGGFSKKNIELGYFELFMNIWAKATK